MHNTDRASFSRSARIRGRAVLAICVPNIVIIHLNLLNLFRENCRSFFENGVYTVAQKWNHFVLRLVTLEVSIRSAPNLALIIVIVCVILPRNSFESANQPWKTKWRHLANDNSDNK